MSVDYAYWVEDTGTQTWLVGKDRQTGYLFATAVPEKGPTPCAIRFFAGVLGHLGYRRLILKSDNEPAIVALKAATGQSVAGLDFIMQESPEYDHSANGEAEVAVREVKRQARAIKIELEKDEKSGGYVVRAVS